MLSSKQTGVTLIELLVGIAIVAVLGAVAAPNFSTWIQNTQIRTASEAVLNGVQLARTEAVRRNKSVAFTLTSSVDSSCAASTSGENWVVNDATTAVAGLCDSPPLWNVDTDAPPRIIQKRDNQSSTNAVVAASQARVVFTALGRVNPAATITIDVSNSRATCETAGGTMRCLRVIVNPGGQMRMCDPQLTVTRPQDPQAC